MCLWIYEIDNLLTFLSIIFVKLRLTRANNIHLHEGITLKFAQWQP